MSLAENPAGEITNGVYANNLDGPLSRDRANYELDEFYELNKFSALDEQENLTNLANLPT